MIIPDINILVHAYNADSRNHSVAKHWWEQVVNGPRPVALPWAVSLGFIRITTHRMIMDRPLRVTQATRFVRSWLACPNVQVIEPGERHGEILFRLLDGLGAAGSLTTDAHLAALAIEYQAEVASTDTDFARMAGVRWFNPLALKR